VKTGRKWRKDRRQIWHGGLLVCLAAVLR